MAKASPVSALQLVSAALYLAVWPGVILVLGGDARWLEAWIFACWFFGSFALVIVYLYVNDPALLAERYRRPGSGGQSGWDRAWVSATLVTYIAWLALMPLDARRFHWSSLHSIALEVVGGALLPWSSFFIFRAFRDNTFLSPLVRIHAERKQHVVSSGVYALVRHPMYLGVVFMFFGTPLLLGSGIGLVVAGILTLLLIVRIVGEERLLIEQLDGYAEYREKVRYRLLPFLW